MHLSSGKAIAREVEILIVAADREIVRPIVEALSVLASIRVAVDSGGMRAVLRSRGIDLLILDTATPGLSALSLCRIVRTTSMVPIIVLMDDRDPEGCIAALEAGADDCFSRATGLREIEARIRSLLRRASFGAAALSPRNSLRFNGWSIDPQSRLLRDSQGAIVELTAAEFDLLWAFCRNRGKAIPREKLLALTHVGAARPVERSIDVHVSRLRRKIEIDPHHPKLLKTIRLGGYLFTPVVEADL